jgi:hypothetical protein
VDEVDIEMSLGDTLMEGRAVNEVEAVIPLLREDEDTSCATT